MRGLLFTITCSVVLITLTACDYNQRKINDAAVSPPENLETDILITADFVQKFSLDTCKKCHDGSNFPQLDSVSMIRLHIAYVQDATNGNRMPPSSMGFQPLSECQKSVLKKWVDLGMPDESSVKLKEVSECDSGQALQE